MNAEDKPTETKDNPAVKIQDFANRPGVEFAIFWGLSVLVYILFENWIFPLNVALFLIIQQVYLQRRGRKSFVSLFSVSALSIFCVIIFILPLISQAFVQKIDGADIIPLYKKYTLIFIIINLWAGVVALGFLFINLFDKKGVRFIFKLLIATGISGLLGIVVMFVVQQDTKLVKEALAFITAVLDTTKKIFNIELPTLPDAALLYLFKSFLFSLFSSFTFIVLSLSWWLGLTVSRRYFKIEAAQLELLRFRIPDTFVWLLIVDLGTFVAAIALSIDILEIVSLNLLIIILSVFMVQGLGITKHFMIRNPFFAQVSRYLPFIVLVLALTASFIFALLWLLISGLGISEIWLHYRTNGPGSVDSN